MWRIFLVKVQLCLKQKLSSLNARNLITDLETKACPTVFPSKTGFASFEAAQMSASTRKPSPRLGTLQTWGQHELRTAKTFVDRKRCCPWSWDCLLPHFLFAKIQNGKADLGRGKLVRASLHEVGQDHGLPFLRPQPWVVRRLCKEGNPVLAGC